ncbi:MAG: RluA family pseudouridine synthase [Oscillochloris sp.]|nr:RluA family pseudouridine synthase [Oscillochloris sp.]
MTEPISIHLVVDAEAAGERLDRYLARAVPDLSRSQAQQLISADQVALNAQPSRASTILRAGDMIDVTIPPPKPVALQPEAIPLTIIYEDADLVVVDKPAGMVVHPAPGHPGGTLVNALLARYPDMQVGGELRPGIVHRLDQDTSGLLVVARNDRTLQTLGDQQRARTMRKIYLAVVEGRMREPGGTIDAPIARHPTNRLRMAVVIGGREARTHYRTLEELAGYTLLEVQLETGRTHQIRVHLQSIGRPVLGDPIYGPQRRKPLFGLRRQFLHAQQLGFAHPADGRPLHFQSPLPSDLAAALDRLRQAAGGMPG